MFSRHNPRSLLIGALFAEGGPFFANLAWRKNLTSGCILLLPCFCQLAAVRAASLCPVHAFWPLIRQRVAIGLSLFKAVSRTHSNRALKAIMDRVGVPEDERYSSHAFRMCTTQELKEVGPPGRLSLHRASGIPLLFGDMSICPTTWRLVPNSFLMATWSHLLVRSLIRYLAGYTLMQTP